MVYAQAIDRESQCGRATERHRIPAVTERPGASPFRDGVKHGAKEMKRELLVLLVATASGVMGEDRSNAIDAWFPDGTGLEIYAESTGSTQINAAAGGITSKRGVDRVFRLVGDRDNNLIFGYFLEAYRNTQTDTTVIRILPLDQETATGMLHVPHPTFHSATGQIPTVSSTHEIQPVNFGQAVTLDILQNPTTGEKIFDVLRPVAGPSQCPASMCVTAVPHPAQLSLKEITLRVNGKAVNAPASWVVGAAVRIDIPAHGAYVISAEDPKMPHFFQTVRADGKSLGWSIDGDQLQVDSKTDIGASGIIWVYHDPNFKSQEQPDAVRVQTADKVAELLPKK
jgi:hypothetical protein